MTLEYKPVKQKYAEYAIEYSSVTDQLLKRKRVLLFTGAKPAEWLKLAEDFKADGGRANYVYCMTEYKKAGGEVEIPEPEFQQLPDEEYDWQTWSGDD